MTAPIWIVQDRKNMYGFSKKSEINDFQMKIADDPEWNFENCLNRFNSMTTDQPLQNIKFCKKLRLSL